MIDQRYPPAQSGFEIADRMIPNFELPTGFGKFESRHFSREQHQRESPMGTWTRPFSPASSAALNASRASRIFLDLAPDPSAISWRYAWCIQHHA
jgi:hypothetical protein